MGGYRESDSVSREGLTSPSFSKHTCIFLMAGWVLTTWPFLQLPPSSQGTPSLPPALPALLPSPQPGPAAQLCSRPCLEVISRQWGPPAVCTQPGKQTELGVGGMKGQSWPRGNSWERQRGRGCETQALGRELRRRADLGAVVSLQRRKGPELGSAGK